MKATRALLCGLALMALTACSAPFRYAPYAFGALNEDPFVKQEGEGFVVPSSYEDLASSDVPSISVNLKNIYSLGGSKRHVLPSVGENYLTVIPVEFPDLSMSLIEADVIGQLQEAFFGDAAFNQYVSLAEYYDKASFHRLHVKGEVTPQPFCYSETYAVVKTKTNAAQTKATLTRIYNEAIAWYNAQSFKTHTLVSGDPVYFVYGAPYSGMDGGQSSRSSMMWAFTINDPAPVCWSSYYMTHPRADGSVDAHTFIHEFGHMLGLKDYYDQTSYTELSACSPLGRMDMMDCSLGEHNAFSKLLLDWKRPNIATGECEITLRPSSGNGDCLLLPLTTFNGTPYDEYLLLEYYTPTYLNYADAALRGEPGMILMRDSGVKAYHVDGRLGLFDDRSKTPRALLGPSTAIGSYSVDFYCDNSGSPMGGYINSPRGFLVQSLEADTHSGRLRENFIASDHNEDMAYGDSVAHLRNVLFKVGQGVDKTTSGLTFRSGGSLKYSFAVTEVAPTYAKVKVTLV